MLHLIEKVEGWAEDRNLIKESNLQAQFVKLVEEVGELASSIAKNNDDKFIDSIGDVLVVLTIMCAQKKVDIEMCLKPAWDEIKYRKGKMIDGVFVKEEDL